MSYQVLARKYRPRSFDTLVGQEHVVRALTHALDQKRLHHAWLFTGTRGVGKTTLSRILAKSLNCQGPDGQGDVTAQPCGVCDACVAIDAGRFVDYIEMDAASNRGVDEMAQLLEQAVYAPSNARYKVYMIDEVHMLTNHAFNAMLKTLEEPPEHVKFILATTDPQKIPVTVLSRCLQFNLKQMPPGHIIGHLDNILNQEGIAFELPALRLLAQGAQGSMRDALSLTDQAIAYSAGEVTLEAVQSMLGALDQSYLVRLLDAVLARDGMAVLAVADEMAARSLSYHTALQDLAALLHRIALTQMVPAALADDIPERDAIIRLAGQINPEDNQLYYQIAIHGRNELGLAPDEYAGFTMTLLRMLAFQPLAPGSQRPNASAGGQSQPATRSVSAAAADTGKVQTEAAQPVARTGAAATAVTVERTQTPLPAPVSRTPVTGSGSRSASGPARAALDAARGATAKGGIPARGSNAGAPVVDSVNEGTAAWHAGAVDKSVASPVSTPVTATVTATVAAPQLHPRAATGSTVRDPAVSGPATAPAPERVASRPPWEDDIPPPAFDLLEGRPADKALPDTEAGSGVQAISAAQVRPSLATPQPVRIPDCEDDWPALAASLPMRGVAQQLAMQSELLGCREEGAALHLHLRIPVDTLLSAGSADKLAGALSERFNRKVMIQTETGSVSQTASAVATAEREQRQREAEQKMQNDPFVQGMMREFGATIVPGSVRPA